MWALLFLSMRLFCLLLVAAAGFVEMQKAAPAAEVSPTQLENSRSLVSLQQKDKDLLVSGFGESVALAIPGPITSNSRPGYTVGSPDEYAQNDPAAINKPTGNFSWKMAQPLPKQQWNGQDALTFQVSIGPVPATKVRLLSTAFINDDSLKLLGNRFKLCSVGVDCSGDPIDLSGNALHGLEIRPEGKVSEDPGPYHGTFTLVAAEKPEGESFQVTLYVSHSSWQVLGAILIASGILTSLFVNVWLQNQNDRNARLMPAAVLADQAARIKSAAIKLVATYSLKLPNVETQLAELEKDLSIESLEANRYVGGEIPYLKMPTGASASPDAYKDFLDQVSKRLTALSIVVHGAREAVDMWGARPVAEEDALSVAVKSIDGLVALTSPTPTRESLTSSLQAILQTLRNQVNAIAGAQDDPGGMPFARPFSVGYTSEHIAFETATSNLVGWLAFAFLSFAVGFYLLVVANPGFGQWRDLLMCLLWGFGVPAAGEKLASLTGPGLAQGFGITLTKVA